MGRRLDERASQSAALSDGTQGQHAARDVAQVTRIQLIGIKLHQQVVSIGVGRVPHNRGSQERGRFGEPRIVFQPVRIKVFSARIARRKLNPSQEVTFRFRIVMRRPISDTQVDLQVAIIWR